MTRSKGKNFKLGHYRRKRCLAPSLLHAILCSLPRVAEAAGEWVSKRGLIPPKAGCLFLAEGDLSQSGISDRPTVPESMSGYELGKSG